MNTTLRLASATALATLVGTGPTFAQDAQRFLDSMNARLATSGATITPGTTTDSGPGAFTIVNSELKVANGRTVKIGEVSAKGYENTGGKLVAERLTVKDLVSEEVSGIVATLGEVTVNNLDYPEPTTTDVEALMKVYTTGQARDFAMTLGGKTLLTIANVSSEITNPTPSESRTVATVDGFSYNVEALPEGRSKKQIIDLGYSQITGSMSIDGVYNLDTGIVDVTDTTFVGDNAATFSMSYSVGGYTREVAAAMSKLNAKYGGDTRSPEATQEFLTLISQLTLRAATIKLTDASLTGKLLELQSKSMGSTPAQLAEMAPMFVTMGMQGLQMPELSADVAKAVGTFLKEQGSLTVTIAPTEPVPFSQLALAGQTNPRGLPALLNLSIDAN